MNPTTFSHIFRKSTISRRFTIITVMFLGVLLGLLGYSITTLYKDRSTAFLIEIAGRQQMLLQKHINEVFLASQGVATDYPSTRELIRSTFIALIEGGSVVLNPETGQRQTVSAAPTEELLTKLHEQLAHFAQIVEHADTFLVLGSDHPEFREQVQTLLAQNTALIGGADKAIKHLHAYSESTIATMVKWEIMIAVAIGLFGILVTNQVVRDGKRLENEIEERKHAESSLQNSELFLNSIIENIPHMIFVKTAKDLHFCRLNKAGEELIGFPKEAMIGKTDYDFFPQAEADFYTMKDREVLSSQTVPDMPEEVIQTKAHGTRYLHTKKIPLFDDQGIPQYLLGISEDITEQKLADLARTEQELLLRLIFETGPGCIKRVAADGTLLHMNSAGLALIEADEANEAVGLSVYDLVVPEHVEAFRQMHQAVLQGKPQTLQFEVQGFKGTRRWMETYAVPFRNPITKEVEQLAITHDITERKQTEEHIRKGERKFRAIYEQAPTGIATLDSINGRFTQINKKYCDIVGYSQKEMLARNFQDITHPDDLQGDFEQMKQLLDGQIKNFQMEKRYIRKNGEVIWVHLTCVPLWLEPTDPRLHIAMVEDITSQKAAVKILQESEERYRILYEDNPSMYFTVAQNGKILSVNRFGAHQLGYLVNELVGQPVIEVFFEDDKLLVQQYFKACLQEPNTLTHWELRKQRKDGSVLWVREVARTITGEDGEAVVLIVCEDITERKQTEERLRQSEMKRTEAFRQSDELKSALLSSVSHELRTPLTAMKASVSGIIGNVPSHLTTVQEEFLKGVDKEINYMSRLVDNLLDMSQIEAGTLIPHQEWHPLEDLVEGALRRTEQALDTRNIEIQIPENVPLVFVDAIEIQQVLINLLDNAVKYSLPASPIRILVRVETQQIEVKVSNIAEPIQSEELERLFERFYRRRSPREQPIRGTGLGLAICKGIVEAHGGRIWAESIGRDVTITFTIPATESMAHFSLEGQHKS